jgi:hypothetical protein
MSDEVLRLLIDDARFSIAQFDIPNVPSGSFATMSKLAGPVNKTGMGRYICRRCPADSNNACQIVENGIQRSENLRCELAEVRYRLDFLLLTSSPSLMEPVKFSFLNNLDVMKTYCSI